MEFKPANQAKDRQRQSLFWFISLRFSFFQYKYKTHEANIISYQSKYNMRNLYENLGLHVLFRLPHKHTHTHTHTIRLLHRWHRQSDSVQNMRKKSLRTGTTSRKTEGRSWGKTLNPAQDSLIWNPKRSTTPLWDTDYVAGIMIVHLVHVHLFSFTTFHTSVIRSSFKKFPKFARIIYKNCYYE